jgi:hypothetical protein
LTAPLIPTTELQTLQTRIEELDQYLIMLDATIQSLKEDTSEMFESYTCPTTVLQSTKETHELIQNAALSYSTLNSAKLILQLLNFWLLYQQTKKIFPELRSFEELLNLWVETKPFDAGLVGRLIAEEEAYKMEQLLAPMHREQLNQNPSLAKKFKLLMEQQEHEFFEHGTDFNQQNDHKVKNKSLFGNMVNSNNDGEENDGNGDNDDDEEERNEEMAQNLLEQLVRLPGILLAQPPPRYNLPKFIHPQHIVKYITSIFATPTLINKESIELLGDDEDGDEHDRQHRLKQTKDKLMKKFATAPTVKAMINSLTLQEDEMKLLFNPPNENEIIDLSRFPKSKIFIRKTIEFDSGLEIFGVPNDNDNGDLNILSSLLSPNIDNSDDLTRNIVIGFLHEVHEKGLPINQTFAKTTLFDVAPLLHTNIFNQITPIPRVDLTTHDITRLAPVYAVQQAREQKEIERNEKSAKREQKRQLKAQKRLEKQTAFEKFQQTEQARVEKLYDEYQQEQLEKKLQREKLQQLQQPQFQSSKHNQYQLTERLDAEQSQQHGAESNGLEWGLLLKSKHSTATTTPATPDLPNQQPQLQSTPSPPISSVQSRGSKQSSITTKSNSITTKSTITTTISSSTFTIQFARN